MFFCSVLMDVIVAPAIVADYENLKMVFDLNIFLEENDVEEHSIVKNIVQQQDDNSEYENISITEIVQPTVCMEFD
jgi:hypothetical protein